MTCWRRSPCLRPCQVQRRACLLVSGAFRKLLLQAEIDAGLNVVLESLHDFQAATSRQSRISPIGPRISFVQQKCKVDRSVSIKGPFYQATM